MRAIPGILLQMFLFGAAPGLEHLRFVCATATTGVLECVTRIGTLAAHCKLGGPHACSVCGGNHEAVDQHGPAAAEGAAIKDAVSIEQSTKDSNKDRVNKETNQHWKQGAWFNSKRVQALHGVRGCFPFGRQDGV